MYRPKIKVKKKYIQTDLTVPKVLLNSYIKNDPVIVRKFSKGGAIFVPAKLVGKRFQMILIPIDEVKDEELNVLY